MMDTWFQTVYLQLVYINTNELYDLLEQKCPYILIYPKKVF